MDQTHLSRHIDYCDIASYNRVELAWSPALSPAFIACSMKSSFLHEFEKAGGGLHGNEANVEYQGFYLR